MNRELSNQVWMRLVAGKRLDGLGLGTIDGRVDLRGLQVPPISYSDPRTVGRSTVETIVGNIELRGVKLRRLDLSDATLTSLRFFSCTIEDCVFDRSICDDWRLWGTKVVRSSFRGTNLRDAGLGGVIDGARNEYRDVDFSGADLRATRHHCAEMRGCRFVDADLRGVDFEGTVFVKCVFEGVLDDVLFRRHAFEGEQFPPNEMRRVDLRRASLRDVCFYGLDLRDVLWPDDGEHIVVADFVPNLDRILRALAGRTDDAGVALTVLFGDMRMHAGRGQRTGVISKHDIRSAAGDGGVREVERLLRDAP